jgi:uncharacterized protein
MQFNVATLLREATGGSRRYVLEEAGAVCGGSVELIRTPAAVLVRVRVDVTIAAACSRCLRDFSYPAALSFEEVFHQQVDIRTGRRLEQPEDADAFLISPVHVIDISEAVRQYSELAAAIQPLCRSDCPGLCPVCGTDLSLASCDCDRSPPDPRWEALTALQRSQGYRV